MFRTKTVLIVGAGASYEVGLPTGDALLQKISSALSFKFNRPYGSLERGMPEIAEAIDEVVALKSPVEQRPYSDKLYMSAAAISKASAQAISIDNLIDAREDENIAVVGKLGIAGTILAAEKNSKHFRALAGDLTGAATFEMFDNTWYSSFSKILTEGVRKSQIEHIFDNLEIICFNYDRCLEHYLPYSLSNYFGGKREDFYDLVNSLPIHRPYGKVGDLPWQEGEGEKVGFGEHAGRDIREAARDIMTFTESARHTKEIQNAVIDADRVIFLGFAYHRQNVELLKGDRRTRQHILGTSFGISASDSSVIQNDIFKISRKTNNIIEPKIELINCTCSDLFKDYWRTLTA